MGAPTDLHEDNFGGTIIALDQLEKTLASGVCGVSADCLSTDEGCLLSGVPLYFVVLYIILS